MARDRRRLKLLFEGRKIQLHQLQSTPMSDRGAAFQRTYAIVVTKYVRARTAWRKFRGWES